VTAPDQCASVRYLVNDVQAAIDFYTIHLGFTLNTSAAPAFADMVRGPLRLLLSGPTSSAARPPPMTPSALTTPHPPDRRRPERRDRPTPQRRPVFRSDVVAGPGGRQILLADPAGNLIELFQPAHQPPTT
jgi:catechol 2,3-dioxygenase-like lactoylglutathione lyase family enzyme